MLGSAMTQKKRRQDPGQEKAKEDRRRKRLAKALKKMDKKERQPKPLSECEVLERNSIKKRTGQFCSKVPLVLQKEAVIRKRDVELGEEEKEARIAQMKDWQRYNIKYTIKYTIKFTIKYTIKFTMKYTIKFTNRYTIKRHSNELWHLDKVLKAQTVALEELRAENESLYDAAIQFDPGLLAMELRGPCASPPVPGYLQDGEYRDTTPTFKVIYEDTEAFMKNLLMRRRTRKKKGGDED